jgi:uncharacterized cupin superfamily protein
MAERRHPHVINLNEAEGRTMTKGTRFGATMKRLGPQVGSKTLGCTHYSVEPGRTAFPMHFHCITEEAIYILAGEGTLRVGEQKLQVGPGDYIAMPVGPDNAHQLLNTGKTNLEYLCVSANVQTADVVGYPDSKKVAAMAAPSRAAAAQGQTWVRFITREDASLDYYDGEDVG